MNINKECYDCGESSSVPEVEIEDGLMRRSEDLVWICPDCRDREDEEVDP